MGNLGEWERKNLVHELTLGNELTKQLQIHLNLPTSSRESCEMLVQKILVSYEKVLSMLNSSSSSVAVAIGTSESPPSLCGSPRSEDSDHQDHSSGERKSLPSWTQQVRVTPGMGLEGALQDGFSWRKYGQKDILGAKHPRGYYRCTQRNVQGCMATKQVQKSDEDPSIFEITYRGKHTCTQANSHIPQALENQKPNSNLDPHKHKHLSHQEKQQQSQELLLNFHKDLNVITEDLNTCDKSFPSFQFPTTSNVKVQNTFSPSMVDNSFVGIFPPSFISPSAFATSFVSASSSGVHHSIGGSQNFQNAESEVTDIISGAASAANSPTAGLGFPFDSVEFDANFTFDNQGFHS